MGVIHSKKQHCVKFQKLCKAKFVYNRCKVTPRMFYKCEASGLHREVFSLICVLSVKT